MLNFLLIFSFVVCCVVIEGTKELTDKIAALEASVGTDTLSPESRAILDDVKAAAATLASIVPNPPADTTGTEAKS